MNNKVEWGVLGVSDLAVVVSSCRDRFKRSKEGSLLRKMVPDPREHNAPTLRHSVSKFFESIDIKIFADALMAKRASGCIVFAPGTGG
jgi:hypothetical protein